MKALASWGFGLFLFTIVMFAFGCAGDDDDSSGDDDDAVDDDTASDDDTTMDDDTGDDDTADDDTVDDDTTPDDDTGDDDTDPGDPIEPTTGFTERCEQYLQDCFTAATPPAGGLYAQICRLEVGGEINETPIRNNLTKAQNREDTSDFGLTGTMRMLYLYADSPYYPEELQADIKETLLGFKFWMDEPGPDDMVFWSENHEALFLQLQLLAGQLWPDEVFTNSGNTGAEQMEIAKTRLRDWFHWRSLFGFTEWHSNVYFNEDVPALMNLADFAEDEEIATLASMTLDLLAFDLALNSYKGFLVAPHGRTYPDKVMGRMSDSMRVANYLWTGNGSVNDLGNFGGTHICTAQRYVLPPLLEDIATADQDVFINRQRDGIDIADGPDWGLTYDDPEHVTFWWSMGAYADWRIVEGTFQTVEDWDMWGGWLWSDIDFLRPLVGSPLLSLVTKAVEPIASGSALEEMHAYIYRTPDYQLASAQDFKPGYWGAQTNVLAGILDGEAVVFTSYPGGMSGDYLGTDWTGGWLPRAAQFENVLVALYDEPWLPLTDHSHAYFPVAAFDEVRENGNWTLGRKGDGYVALWSQTTPEWASPPNDGFELIADAMSNVWVMEMGRAAVDGSFDDFEDAVTGASIGTDGLAVLYDSPSVGLVEYAYEGDFVVDGAVVESDGRRFNNDYCVHELGDNPYVISDGGATLELDYEMPRRRYFAD